MMKTPHADAFLVTLVHPIAPRHMRTLVYQLVRDNAVATARELAGVMVAWSHHAPGEDDFYYWLGVEQTLRALSDGEMDRWRIRSDRTFKRTLAKREAAISRARGSRL